MTRRIKFGATVHRRKEAENKPTYGGFYTQEEIKDVVKFAAERGVNIVPEIEMPGMWHQPSRLILN